MSNERFRAATERAQTLLRKANRLTEMVTASPEEETDRAAELAAVADELGALFEEYRDVFPDLPISPETFRLHVRQLKEANDEARQAEEEATELSAKLTEARQRLDASLSESARLDKKPTKPN